MEIPVETARILQPFSQSTACGFLFEAGILLEQHGRILGSNLLFLRGCWACPFIAQQDLFNILSISDPGTWGWTG